MEGLSIHFRILQSRQVPFARQFKVKKVFIKYCRSIFTAILSSWRSLRTTMISITWAALLNFLSLDGTVLSLEKTTWNREWHWRDDQWRCGDFLESQKAAILQDTLASSAGYQEGRPRRGEVNCEKWFPEHIYPTQTILSSHRLHILRY